MKKYIMWGMIDSRIVFSLVLILLSVPSGAADPAKIYDKNNKSVLMVYGYDVFGKQQYQGSGVVVGADMVLTNCHLIGESGKVTVVLNENNVEAQVTHKESKRDLCLLKVPKLNRNPVSLSNNEPLKVGRPVFAIGSPRGLEASLSDGIISSLRHINGDEIIQTTAGISQGSSGGGLFDAHGKLIGITTLFLKDATNIAFAYRIADISSIKNNAAKELAKLVKIAKERHDIDAAFALANRYYYGVGVSKSRKEAAYYFHAVIDASEKDWAAPLPQESIIKILISAARIAELYNSGIDSYDKRLYAARWYKNIAELGYRDPAWELQHYNEIQLASGRNITWWNHNPYDGTPQPDENSLQESKRLGKAILAKVIHGEATRMFGNDNFEGAYALFKTSAYFSGAEAPYMLGFMHENGYGVPKDNIAALFWYGIAAKSPLEDFGSEAADKYNDLRFSVDYEILPKIDKEINLWLKAYAYE